MTTGSDTLRYAIRPRVVGRFLGQLGLMLLLLALVPLAVSFYFNELHISLRYGEVVLFLGLFATPLARLPASAQIQTNEALAIAALAFLLTPLIMTYPMMGSGLSFMDALFEAVSAVTTTGLSTVTQLRDMPHTFLFARAWMQWYGGLGIIVLSVALLFGNHGSLRRLVETTAGESLEGNARLHARRTLLVYVTLTLIGILALWLYIGDGFVALTHALAAISTGGFSPYDTSLAGLGHWGERFAVMSLGLLGALPLILYFNIRHNGVSLLWRDEEVPTFLLLSLGFGALFSLLLALSTQLSPTAAIGHGMLLGLSAQSTTGFASLPLQPLGDPLKLAIIVSMLIGGSLGSTAGGFKIFRLLIALRLFQFLLRRTAMPTHAISQPRLGDRILENDEMLRALFLILLYIAMLVISWLVFLFYGYPSMDALFEVSSALGTVGLSVGVTRPELEPLLKTILCVDMWLGRLEVIALLVVLYPPSWIGKRAE